jgi:hypothetical protein
MLSIAVLKVPARLKTRLSRLQKKKVSPLLSVQKCTDFVLIYGDLWNIYGILWIFMDIYGYVWHVQFGRLEWNQSKCDSKQEERSYGGSYPYVNGEKVAGRHGHFTVEPLFLKPSDTLSNNLWRHTFDCWWLPLL